MIELTGVSKLFGKKKALNGVSINVEDGHIYGLVGSNGSGKSTLLRIMSGVYKADGGKVSLDGKPIFNCPESKRRISYISDDIYFPAGADLSGASRLYRSAYEGFDPDLFVSLTKEMGLPLDKSVSTFSKGMKRQAATALALSVRADYLLLDETFDGLDPIMKGYVKTIISREMLDRGASAIITSHSLRELEDTVDKIAFIHNGDLVLDGDTDAIKNKYAKLQVGFADNYGEERFEGISYRRFRKSGSVCSMILSEDIEGSVERVRAMSPIILDVLPLSLEELFSCELEMRGYCLNES